MARILSLTTGIALIALGGLLLSLNVLVPTLRLNFGLWHLWPLALAALSLFFILPPLLRPRPTALGGLFIPGSVLAGVSGVGVLAGFWQANAWGTFWPLIIIALAVGFGLAAFYLKIIWLLVPTFVLGLIGAALQFAALTHWWGAWSVLWLVIPLAVGLAFVVIGLVQRSVMLIALGAFISGGTVWLGLSLATLITGLWLSLNGVIGIGLIALGGLMLAWNRMRALKLA